MDSLKRIILALAYFAIIFGGTLYLYPIDRGLALIFNLVCLGILSSYLAHKKQRNAIGWFFIGTFTGILGVAFAISLKPKGNS